MSDTDKFRVWDASNKKYYEYGYGIMQNGELFDANLEKDVAKTLIIERCSGRRDKNNKLMYRNDIVQCRGCIGIVVFGSSIDNQFSSFRVIWIIGNEKIKYFHRSEVEIIGTVNENPNLVGNFYFDGKSIHIMPNNSIKLGEG